ncbi:General substrate transporter [Niveomyces insectorum RCEF 264]|uniref:General substrate transporter n=1 Tax=Niveomyces insectorum RCEF 264 TaxID=1081102 RepID=A0A162I8A5_9HYPO|nr:General substrate transporter [Niveomyces insectorum RCEF 264]
MAAVTQEERLPEVAAVKRYPTTVLRAMAMSFTIIIEGYDTVLISSLTASNYYPGIDRTELAGSSEVGLGDAAKCGAVVGLLINGYITECWSHRRVTLAALVIMCGLVFVSFFAPSVEVLLAGQVLVGVPWGLVAAGVLQGLVNNTTVWAFRIPFAIMRAWPVPIFFLAFFAPDSPWWLVRKGRLDDAAAALKRPSANLPDELIRQKVAMMVHTNNFEQSLKMESSYRDCFSGTSLRRTEIACMVLSAQSLPGQPMCYSASYFFTQAGLSADNAYKLSFGSMGLAFVGTCVSWVLMNFFGRRPLIVAGLSGMALILLVIGCLSYAGTTGGQWAQSALAMVWLGVYSATVGPRSFALAAEVSATRLRSQTISIARNAYAYNVVNMVDTTIEPYLINPTEANLGGETGFFWFGIGVLTTLWAVFRLPGTSGRTYAELDVLFDEKIPAWRFAKEKIAVIAETEMIQYSAENKHKVEQADA